MGAQKFPAELELATTVQDGFTIAVVGDIIIANPQSMNPDPGFQAVASDIKAMGFDIVARSNNHAGEYGYEGLLETNRWLDEAGVVYAGSGENYWSARAARFVDTRMGRVGMVATASSFPSTMMATPARGEWP
jgi:poly-gamma-glutamate synthesis protein (capsule biosynthesis protein)